MGWSISPVVPYEIINGKLVAHFGINTSQSEIVYTITYDENGCVSTYTYTIPPCESDTCIIAQQTVQFDKNEQNSAIIASYNDSCDVSTASYTVSLVSPTTDIFVNNVSFNNNKTITAHINANSNAERYNKVILSMGSTTKEITITQASGIIPPPTSECSVEQLLSTIPANPTIEMRLFKLGSDCDGFTIELTGTYLTNYRITGDYLYALIQQNTGDTRTVILTITQTKQGATFTKNYTFTQEPGVIHRCGINMGDAISVDSGSHSNQLIGTYIDCEGLTPTVTSNNTDFIAVSDISFSNGRIYANISGNETHESRSAYITIQMGEANEYTTIEQEGKQLICDITMDASYSFTYNSYSDEEIGTYTNCEGDVPVVTSTNTDFIPTSNVSFYDGIIYLNIDGNESTSSRSTTITIDMGEAYESTIIAQEGKPAPTPCEITLLSSKTVGSEAGSDVEVGSYNQYCTVANISATSSNQSFISDSDIAIENGTISLSYDENEEEDARSTVITVTYNGGDTKTLSFTQNAASSPVLTFDELLDEFNLVLQSRGIDQISETGTPNTYQYLSDMYTATVQEYNDANDLFNKSNFPDVYDYHGNNDANSGLTKTIMTSWVMASCLSELFPSSGSSANGQTNNQTEFFKKAYELGGGSSIGIYDTSEGEHQGYTMKSDPIICRLVASEIYAHERGKRSFNEINGYRNDVDSGYTNGIVGAINWDGLGCEFDDDDCTLNQIGYVVNSAKIIPCAPGPYSIFADPGHGYPWDGDCGKQPEALFQLTADSISGEHGENGTITFDDDTTTVDWKYMNYKRDAEIDEYVTRNYNLGSWSYGKNVDGEDGIKGWENMSSKDDKILVLKASVVPTEPIRYYYGTRTLAFCGTTTQYKDDCCQYYTKYVFSEWGEPLPVVLEPGSFVPSGDNTQYELVGPFGDLEDKLFNGSSISPAGDYIERVRVIGNDSRLTTNAVDSNCDIRRRPLGDYEKTAVDYLPDCMSKDSWLGRKHGTGVAGGIIGVNGHPLNGIGNGSAQAVFVPEEAADLFVGDDFPRDSPNSYISGHAAQTWMVGLMLAQLFGAIGDDNYTKAKQYLSGAYGVGVGRVIGRFHWNSDTLYGRMAASMNLPVVNAMSSNNDSYECAKTILSGGECHTSVFSGTFGSIKFINNTGQSGYTTGVGAIYLENPHLSILFDLVGGLIDDSNADVNDNSCNRIVINPYSSVTFNNVYFRIRSNDPSDVYSNIVGKAISASAGYLYTNGLMPDGETHYHINGAYSWSIEDAVFVNGANLVININNIDYSPTEDGWQYVVGDGSMC